jgi:hypothetical protein
MAKVAEDVEAARYVILVDFEFPLHVADLAQRLPRVLVTLELHNKHLRKHVTQIIYS